MQRATKIVATLGPASAVAGRARRACSPPASTSCASISRTAPPPTTSGARAHGARGRAQALGREVAIMADLQGPKIRVGKFADGKVDARRPGQTVHPRRRVRARRRRARRPRLQGAAARRRARRDPAARRRPDPAARRIGRRAARSSRASSVGGVLSNNKGINRQGGGLTAPALTAKDMDDIKTAVAIAGRLPRGVVSRRTRKTCTWRAQLLRAAGGNALLIAKIERAEAIPALDEIIDASDGIMVARGDLAVEVGNAAVPGAAEAHDPHGARAQQAHDHRDADDGVDDRQPGADARRGLRRRQRGARRHRRGDALGRDGRRAATRSRRSRR